MESSEKNRVYIGHLPDDVSAQELADALDRFGRVRDVDIKYGRTRNGTAYAFVEFADAEGAAAAIAESGSFAVAGTRVRVEYTGGVRKPRPAARDAYPGSSFPQRSENKVIVAGLPKNTSWQDLKDHMRKAGAVGFAVVYGQGVGLVEYRDSESVQEALTLLNNSTIMTHVDLSGTISVYLPEDYPHPLPSSRRRSSSPYRRSVSPRYSRDRRSPRRSPSDGYRGYHRDRSPPVDNYRGYSSRRSPPPVDRDEAPRYRSRSPRGESDYRRGPSYGRGRSPAESGAGNYRRSRSPPPAPPGDEYGPPPAAEASPNRYAAYRGRDGSPDRSYGGPYDNNDSRHRPDGAETRHRPEGYSRKDNED